jgi:hypothetical protein
LTKPLIITAGVQRRLAELQPAEKQQCAVALLELCETFGRPHVHSGPGVRKLLPGIFECRGTIALRFVFRDTPEGVIVVFLGNHDEVQTLIRSRRFP